MTRSEALEQLKAVYATLSNDLDASLRYGQVVNNEYAQRSLVRTVFALIEGVSYHLRQVTLATIRDTDKLSHEEISLLNEVRHTLDEKGRPRVSEQFLPFPQSLLFSMQCYVKNHDATFKPDSATPGWAAIKAATIVRNRVTHPKAAESLNLSMEDLR